MPLARKPVSSRQAKERLQDLCVRGEQCTYQLRTKLKQWQIPADEADKIMQSLEDERYVDDARYARSFVHDKVRFAGWGRRKLHMMLAAKRIPSDIIAEALAEIDPNLYSAVLIKVLQSKTRPHPELLQDYEGRTRLYRFALQRGFESDAIAAALKALTNT